MQAEEAEYRQQQPLHSEKRVVEQRGSFRIQMVGVGVEFHKIQVRLRMTLRAGRDAVLARQLRADVLERVNVVGAMAIRAFGGRTIAQVGELPVQAVGVALRQILVTIPAAVVNAARNTDDFGS